MPLQFPQHSISEAVAVHEVPQPNVFSLWTFRFDNLKKIIPSRCWTSSLHINEFSGIYALAHFVPNTRDKKYTEPLCPFCILLNSCNINLSEESTWNVYLGAQPNISKKIHLGLCGHQSPTWTPLKLPQLIHGHTCLPWKHDRESKMRDTPF